ncbi:hypothetical protein HPB52_000982 [Rhipicephalus sanguineus]|uniref:Uncharacterized protein n=1 Tax=Rhipicephalus sanguineus TaxID=34632 RepID=A0A9D4T862_RHISA|nr:hypothetical protein HPB52_000982 [Rhipicephalus sanguineus]
MGPRGQKLPPLPKDDYKIDIRPHQGLPLKVTAAPALARAIIEACGNQFTDEKFILLINRGSNIAILSTKYSEVAELVRKLQQLAINARPHQVRTYVATGEEALRGVVRGIQPNTSIETLMTHLRIRTQCVELVQTIMIGNTKSAALTFYGDKLPRTVYLNGRELICHPFRAILQVCKVCRGKGHRADVCPQADKPTCRLCGTRNPTTGHPRQLIWASCEEAHFTGDPRGLSQCNCATEPVKEVRNNYLHKLPKCRRNGFLLLLKKKLSNSEDGPLGLHINLALALTQDNDPRQPRRRTRKPSKLARQLHSGSTTSSNSRG